MKVSINQVKINRVGINTACIQGVRLGSASKGGQTSPFHPSLVDYWNFKGKSNADEDRNVIKGVKRNILTAYNFGWALGSGYGIYNTNFNTQWNDTDASYGKIINSNLIKTYKVGSVLYVAAYYDSRNFLGNIKGKITGMPEGYSLYIGISTTLYLVTSNNGDFIINKNDIPVLILDDGVSRYNGGFKIMKTGNLGGGQEVPCDVTIELIPEYEGAIVTDGVDDYLKLDKVGYKVGTIIIKFKPINIKPNIVNSILNIHTDEVALQYDTSGVLNNNFTTYKNYGEYSVGTFNIDKNAATPLALGCKLSNSGSPMEYSNVAIYSVAIYQNVLTAEEIQKEIKVMEYGTPNPVFALNFDNFAYKAVDYPDFATGKATTNKIVVNSTTATFNGFIAAAYNPELTTGDAIELPSYKVKVTGIDAYSNLGDGYWAVALMGMPIDTSQDPWVYLFHKDGIYDIPAISLSDGIFNLSVMCQITVDKPIEIEILYDKNIAKSFPETKQIFP